MRKEKIVGFTFSDVKKVENIIIKYIIVVVLNFFYEVYK
jgi:hypothetical protein